MADVPSGRVEEIQTLLGARHPEADNRGVEPTVPMFPQLVDDKSIRCMPLTSGTP